MTLMLLEPGPEPTIRKAFGLFGRPVFHSDLLTVSFHHGLLAVRLVSFYSSFLRLGFTPVCLRLAFTLGFYLRAPSMCLQTLYRGCRNPCFANISFVPHPCKLGRGLEPSIRDC